MTGLDAEQNGATAIGPFVRAQLLTRLREAVDIAEGDVEQQLPALRERVADVLERIDALELPAATLKDRKPRSRFVVAAQTNAQGDPVTEFLLIPYGEVVVERPIAGGNFVFTPQHAEAAVRWFEQMGRKLAIDYEHQSFERLNTRRDGLRPAAGWIGGLELRDDGLWATSVDWTERAAELLASGEYRYFSPVIFWTDADQTSVAGLGPVALTNDPAMRGVTALAAGHAPDEAVSGEATVAQQRLDRALAEIAALQRQLAGQQADAFIERGLRAGKIVDATSLDWREDYLRDPAATEARLARSPVLMPAGRVTDRGPDEALRTHGGLSATAAGVASEDLAAFERARATGRVVGSVV